MDHKEQHHQHHQHEREEHKREQKAYERDHEKQRLPFHPAWLVGVVVALLLVAVLIWTFILP